MSEEKENEEKGRSKPPISRALQLFQKAAQSVAAESTKRTRIR
jgi:hypothetical protein